MARPGSRGYRQACAAAAGVAARSRPDLSEARSTLRRTVGEARSTELAEWSPAARGVLVAEIEHLRRVVELLPPFDQSLRQMILPGDDTVENVRVSRPLALAAN